MAGFLAQYVIVKGQSQKHYRVFMNAPKGLANSGKTALSYDYTGKKTVFITALHYLWFIILFM